MNDWSRNYNELKSSVLFHYFSSEGIIDPILEEEKGAALSFRGDFDRSDSKAVVMKLHEKYDDRTLGIMPMEMHSATIGLSDAIAKSTET